MRRLRGGLSAVGAALALLGRIFSGGGPGTGPGFRVLRVALVLSILVFGVWGGWLLSTTLPLRSETRRVRDLVNLELTLETELAALRKVEGWVESHAADLRELGVAVPDVVVDEAVRRDLVGRLAGSRRLLLARQEALESELDRRWDRLHLLMAVLLVQATIALGLLDYSVRARSRIADLYRRATRDALTGLFNRPAILELGEREIERCRRRKVSMAVMLVDIDLFKQINDRLGHAAGDRAIRLAASRLEGSIRTTDAAGRYGGDEFLVVLPDCDAEQTELVAERLREAFDAPLAERGGPERMTVSIGAAVVRNGDAELDRLIETADRALYSVKERGRNAWSVVSHVASAGDGAKLLPQAPPPGAATFPGDRRA